MFGVILVLFRKLLNDNEKIISKKKLFFFAKLILFFYILIYNKFFICKLNILTNEKYFNEENNEYFKNFTNLKSLNINGNLISIEKKKILQLISKVLKKNIFFVNKIYFKANCRFGNCLILLNKYIHFCEIVGCNTIILDEKNFWFLKSTMILKKNNINFILNNIKYYNETSIITYDSFNLFYKFFNIKPEIKIHLFRKEILQNLPVIKISKEQLYIHIRSGDIFTYCPLYPYAQPPLCFYDNIIQNFNYSDIVIISSSMENPVIQKLINKYPNILYNLNPLKYDVAILINAFNIVASISSFLTSIIQLNCNLNYLWDYNIYNIKQKIRHYHYDFYKFPFKNFINYRMEPSFTYKKVMQRWKNSKRQRKLMLKEKCNNFFRVIYL